VDRVTSSIPFIVASLVFAVVGLPVLAIGAKAFALVKLWEWYVSPTFAVPPLDMLHAIGLSLIVSLFRPSSYVPGSRAAKEATEGVEQPIMTATTMLACEALIPLLLGWIGTFWL
jgi:hypothetical protein